MLFLSFYPFYLYQIKSYHRRSLAKFLIYMVILLNIHELSIIFVYSDRIASPADVFYICYVSLTCESRTNLAFLRRNHAFT